ncbi:hypothetical protein AB0G04_09780 [Actinoplanes sp. NPDC023801]|uniref:hypothetical protein n=1 Tax=Actinoplanes sp. NPDC023801 TaxID=3154595 RepID=UPI0033EDFF47
MTSREVAVSRAPGEALRQGAVVRRRGPRAAVLVRWENGQEELVSARDATVKYAFEGTRRLEWLLKPGLLESEFRADPARVFTDVIRDEGKKIFSLQIKRRIIELGLPAKEVDSAFLHAKSDLGGNHHLVISAGSHSWSDEPVDPYANLRSLPPRIALDRLLSGKRLKAAEREVLIDNVRAALPAD